MKEATTTIEHKTTQKAAKPTLIYLAAGFFGTAMLCGLSFFAGTIYQRGHSTMSSSGNQNGNPQGSTTAGGFGMRARRGGIGSVTAVSASSISVQNQRTGTVKTYTINGSTTVTDNGTTSAVSNIQVGDVVLVRPSVSDPTVAGTIVLNPSFGGSPTGVTTPAQST